MNDRFAQLNALLNDELSRTKNRGKTKRIWLAAILALPFLAIIAIISLLAAPRLSEGKNLSQSLNETLADIKTAALIASPNAINPAFALNEPKTFLLLGVPGAGNDAPDLTDTIILLKLEPNPVKATMISIPRDLFVKIPDSEQFVKINSLYAIGKAGKNAEFGLNLIKQKVEEVSGQKIDNYFLIDLSAVKQIINDLGGLNVYVAQDIVDNFYPGPNHSYQTFEIKAGWRYLDGEEATKYMRSRHSLNGDFDRIERQQQVLLTLKQKVAGLNPIFDLPELLDILNKLQNNIKTDIPMTDYPLLWQLAKKITPDQINKIAIDREESDLLVSGSIQYDNGVASILKPKAGEENYNEIQKFIAEAIN